MGWHYQLMYHEDGDYYAVHEYYNLEGGPVWTEAAITVTGHYSMEDVVKSLKLMLKDIEKHGVKFYGTEVVVG